MRTPHNDTAVKSPSKAARRSEEPERRCILTGDNDGRDAMLRLAISPDDILVPDVLAKAPGRGAWLGVDRAALEIALAKGKLKGALARAFKGAKIVIPDDLPDLIEKAFRQQFLAHLGLAAKAGALLSGAEKVDVAARSGVVTLLAHASDAADDGRRKRDQSWRVGSDAEGSGLAGRILPVDRTTLAVALGRDNVVHIALTDAGWASRVTILLDRWQRYAGSATGAADCAALPDENTAPAPLAGAEDAAVVKDR